GGQDTVRTDEGIKLALPNRTPTSPRGTVILGLAFMSGLLAGIGLAIWRDRHGLKPINLSSGREPSINLDDCSVRWGSLFKHWLFRDVRGDFRSFFARRRPEITPAKHEPPTCDAGTTLGPPRMLSRHTRRRRKQSFKWP